MKIDSHQHFWHYSPQTHGWITEEMKILKRHYLPEDLALLLQAQGFDGCIAVQANQSLSENSFLLGLAEDHSFIKGVVGWVDLQSAQVEAQLKQYAQHPQFVGVRHVVQSESDAQFLQREAFCNGISLLAAYRLSYDILVYSHQLPSVIQFVSQFPDQAFVIDHLAKPDIKGAKMTEWETHIREVAKAPHVMCKLSGMITEADWEKWTFEDLQPYLEVVYDAFGAERLMIGSDWPVCLLAGSYESCMNATLSFISQFPAHAQAQMLGENAYNFYLGSKG